MDFRKTKWRHHLPWILQLLAFAILGLYAVITCVKKARHESSKPDYVTTSLGWQDKLPFPAITVCPQKSELPDLVFSDILKSLNLEQIEEHFPVTFKTLKDAIRGDPTDLSTDKFKARMEMLPPVMTELEKKIYFPTLMDEWIYKIDKFFMKDCETGGKFCKFYREMIPTYRPLAEQKMGFIVPETIVSYTNRFFETVQVSKSTDPMASYNNFIKTSFQESIKQETPEFNLDTSLILDAKTVIDKVCTLSNGERCVFPFNFADKQYSTCVFRDHPNQSFCFNNYKGNPSVYYLLYDPDVPRCSAGCMTENLLTGEQFHLLEGTWARVIEHNVTTVGPPNPKTTTRSSATDVPLSNSSVCFTSKGYRCDFSILYMGREMKACLTNFAGTPWCYTNPEEDNSWSLFAQPWGFCTAGCEVEDKETGQIYFYTSVVTSTTSTTTAVSTITSTSTSTGCKTVNGFDCDFTRKYMGMVLDMCTYEDANDAWCYLRTPSLESFVAGGFSDWDYCGTNCPVLGVSRSKRSAEIETTSTQVAFLIRKGLESLESVQSFLATNRFRSQSISNGDLPCKDKDDLVRLLMDSKPLSHPIFIQDWLRENRKHSDWIEMFITGNVACKVVMNSTAVVKINDNLKRLRESWMEATYEDELNSLKIMPRSSALTSYCKAKPAYMIRNVECSCRCDKMLKLMFYNIYHELTMMKKVGNIIVDNNYISLVHKLLPYISNEDATWNTIRQEFKNFRGQSLASIRGSDKYGLLTIDDLMTILDRKTIQDNGYIDGRLMIAEFLKFALSLPTESRSFGRVCSLHPSATKLIGYCSVTHIRLNVISEFLNRQLSTVPFFSFDESLLNSLTHTMRTAKLKEFSWAQSTGFAHPSCSTLTGSSSPRLYNSSYGSLSTWNASEAGFHASKSGVIFVTDIMRRPNESDNVIWITIHDPDDHPINQRETEGMWVHVDTSTCSDCVHIIDLEVEGFRLKRFPIKAGQGSRDQAACKPEADKSELYLFSLHTWSNCRVDCGWLSAFRLCGCWALDIPAPHGGKVCSLAGTLCFRVAVSLFASDILPSSHCNCQHACDATFYRVKTVSVTTMPIKQKDLQSDPFKAGVLPQIVNQHRSADNQLFINVSNLPFNIPIKSEEETILLRNLGIVRLQLSKDKVPVYTEFMYYDSVFENVFAWAGGYLAFFTGICMLSIMDMIYNTLAWLMEPDMKRAAEKKAKVDHKCCCPYSESDYYELEALFAKEKQRSEELLQLYSSQSRSIGNQ